MKKFITYLFGVMALFNTSCQEFDNCFTATEIAHMKFENEYNSNFERDYGKIADNHTWGFGDITNNIETRADGESQQYRIVRPVNSVENIEPIIGGSKLDSNCQYAYENCPDAITDDERTYVFNYLQQHPNEGSTVCELNNYFLQNLGQNYHEYEGTKIVNEGTEHERKETVIIDNRHMDNLHFDDIHFQTYNSSIGFDYYVTNTAIIDPYYQDSSHDGEAMKNHYRFYYIPGYGVYLCFDYVTNSPNGAFAGDNKYDDWVIKVCPGENETICKEYRVFCEDLGSTYDLDFNDLVFDYVELGDNNIAITVLALEGTLPIYIDSHDLKGDDLTPHHNVSMNTLYVNKSITSEDLIKVETGFHGTCFIANQIGRAPYLLRCPVGTVWCDEYERIETRYPDFIFYVSDPNLQWWNNFEDFPIIVR